MSEALKGIPDSARDFRAPKKPELSAIQGGKKDRVSPPPIPQEKTSPRPGSSEWAQMRHEQKQREHEARLAQRKADWDAKAAADRARSKELSEAPLLSSDLLEDVPTPPPVPGASAERAKWSIEQKNKAFRAARDKQMEEFLAPEYSSDLLQEDASRQSPPPVPLEVFAPRRRSEVAGSDSGDFDDIYIPGEEKAEIEQVNRELGEAFRFNPGPKGQERRVPENETEEERVNRELGEAFGFVPDTEAHESEDHHAELSENIQAIDQLLQGVVLNQEQRAAANQALGEIIIKKGTGDAEDLAEAYALADVLMNRLEKVSLLQSHVKGDRESRQKARRLREFKTSTSGINEIPSEPTYIPQSPRPRARINRGGTSGMWGQRSSSATASRSYRRKSVGLSELPSGELLPGEMPKISPMDAGRSRSSRRGSRIEAGRVSSGRLGDFATAPRAVRGPRRNYNQSEYYQNAESARQNELYGGLTKQFEKATPEMDENQRIILLGAIKDERLTPEEYMKAQKDSKRFGLFGKSKRIKSAAQALLARVERRYDRKYAEMPNQENINTQSFRIR